MPVCAKMTSPWDKDTLSIANGHVSLGAVQGAVASVALAAGVSLVYILQAGDWTRVST